MNPLQQTALDFCRECMNWDPKPSIIFPDTLMVLRDGERQAWRITDLDAVLEAVREWCSKNQFVLFACWLPEMESPAASISKGEMSIEVENPDIRHALMSACLEAHRKLKGITHD